jgi:hypothetical protein
MRQSRVGAESAWALTSAKLLATTLRFQPALSSLVVGREHRDGRDCLVRAGERHRRKGHDDDAVSPRDPRLHTG